MEYKYIPSIPKNLLNDLINNKVIPFIGAGFSKNADIPVGLSMPDWMEIGKLAAAEIADYDYDSNAIDALSYYEDLYSRTKLVEFLMEKLNFGKIHPGATHKALCELFTGIICTTNFDTLLEDQMTFLHRPVSIIATQDRLTIDNMNESKIIKLNGDFNHPERMVITENDYDIYIEKNPIFATYIANLFITKTMLLIGYSLDDNDFRGIWKIINNRLGNMAQPAYCIVVNAKQEKIARYRRRNIKIINIEGENGEYKELLYDFLVELKTYVDRERDKTAESTNEKINEQMIIPAEDNKLCFVSCSMSRISQLLAILNPVLNSYGITIVRIDDMLMPGDNWIDIASTAIRKSRAAIIDISDATPNVMIELGLIKATKKQKNVLIICEKGKNSFEFDLNGQSVLQYTFDILDEEAGEYFRRLLDRWAFKVFCDEGRMYGSNKCGIFSDAHRLFQKGEYSACIISACSELEYQLSMRRSGLDSGNINLFYFYVKKYLRDNRNDIGEANKLVLLRNDILYRRYVATKIEALEFIKFIERIYEFIIKDKDK